MAELIRGGYYMLDVLNIPDFIELADKFRSVKDFDQDRLFRFGNMDNKISYFPNVADFTFGDLPA
jgi:hypothetical protein